MCSSDLQEAADADAKRDLLDRLENMSEAEARALLGEDPSTGRQADAPRYEVPPSPQRATQANGAAPNGRQNGSASSGKQIIISVGETSVAAERETHRS